jgi:hypothetical protein
MIEWMKTLPQDAEVECGVEVTGGYSTYMEMRPVDIEYSDVLDYTGPEYDKYPNIRGKVMVMIRGG